MEEIQRTEGSSDARTMEERIDEFFYRQVDVHQYRIRNKEQWVVDVEGSIHLYPSDLNRGELFFKIGNLSGNLYYHCEEIRRTVFPEEFNRGRGLVFVVDEDVPVKAVSNSVYRNSICGMGMLLQEARPWERVKKDIIRTVSTSINIGHGDELVSLVEEIKKELEYEEKHIKDYQLVMKATKDKGSGNIDCRFYVTDPEGPATELDIKAIEKALYILYILHKEGLVLNITTDDVKDWQKIYSQMAGRSQDDRNGIMGGKTSDMSINSYRSHIRKALEKKFYDDEVIDLFAIEGFKEERCYVKKATDELRAQIREVFNLN